MRTFVAIDIPADIRRRIVDLLAAVKPTATSVRWARPEGMHITLKFLGQIPEGKVEAVRTNLASVQPSGPFPLRVQGAGFFPNERSPRVVWLGVEGGTELAELAGRVEESLVPLGIPKEGRPFAAHLTLGRLRAPDKLLALKEVLRRRDPLALGSFTAEEFFLYESKPAPEGSIYRKIARFKIAAGGP